MTEILRLVSFLRADRRWVALSVALSAAAVLANIALMATSGWFITAMGIAGLAGAAMNYFTPAAMIRTFAIVRTGGRYAERLISHEATFRLLAALRTWFYARIEPLAPAGLQPFRSGDLYTRIRNDIDRLELFFLRVFAPVAVALAVALAVVAFVAFYDLRLALVLLGLFVAAGVLLPALAVRRGAGPSRRITAATVRLNMMVVDSVEGLAELHLHGQADARVAALERLSDDIIDDETRLARLAAMSQAGVGLAANLAMLAALMLAVPAVAAGHIAAPNLTMLALLALASFEAIAPIPLAMQSLPGTLASARRLFAIADAPPPVRDPAEPAPVPPEGTLAFEDVGLTYPGARAPALTGIDLELAPGRRIAIIGPSGSGKSSLVALALRFFAPTQGRITYAGVALDRFAAEELRRRFAVVSQHAHLFTATIADNLRIAHPDASTAEIEAACRIAQIHDFIAGQPDGYATYVGANGLKLSGGQARRLAVARALLVDAPVLVLDEPTEGMDADTERALVDAVLDARAGRAVLLITHRPVLLERMDEIVRIENGRIAGRGSGLNRAAAGRS